MLAPVALLIGLTSPGFSVIGLALTGVLLGFAVQMNPVYMTSIFLGGALGSAVASALFAEFGWQGVALVGAGLPGVALIVFLIQARRGL
jgi:cyanate permease